MFLMKKSLLVLLSGLNGQRNKKESQREIDESGLGRRYTDLTKIAKHYMPDFDERKVNLNRNSKNKFKFKNNLFFNLYQCSTKCRLKRFFSNYKFERFKNFIASREIHKIKK